MPSQRAFRFNTLTRALIAALSFVAAFAVIVLVQFSGRDRIKANAGSISITGIRDSSAGDDANASSFPLSLNIDFQGIGFSFGHGRPLAAERRDGTRAIVKPLSWSAKGRRVSVELEGGAAIDFEAGPDGESFAVHTRFGPSGLRALSLPYSLSGSSFQANLGERLSVRTRGGVYTLGLPEGSRLDAEGFTLNLGERKNAFSLALVRKPARVSPSPGDAAKFVRRDAERWRAGLDSWTGKTYAGLVKGRYAPESLAWTGGAAPAFSDQALAVLIAEALSRGAYADIRPMLTSLAKGRAESLGWKSSVYLGNIIRKEELLRAETRTRASGIASRIAAKDPGILLEPDIVHLCVDRAPELMEPFLAVVANIDAEGLSPSIALGVLLCLAEAESYFPDAENPFARREAAALEAFQPAIQGSAGTAFVTLETGRADIALQCRAGAALMRIGAFREDEGLSGTGRALAASALILADDNGVLPAKVEVSNGQPGAREGVLLPEDVYAAIAENPWYPRARSLFREAGKGAWLLACSPRIGIEWGKVQANISADWPVGATHYMYVFGIEPVVLMRLYEIPYNPDPSFDRYNASGYLYSRASRVLFLKMKHKAEREYVRMNF